MTQSKRFHLAFLMNFTPDEWQGPFGHGGRPWDGAFYVDMARALERACFDYIIIEDKLMVPESYGGSSEAALRHALVVPKHDPAPLAVVVTAIASGVGFAFFFICLSRTTANAGLWPLVASRVVTIGGFVAIGVGTTQSFRMPRGAIYMAAAGGLVDVCANTCYVLSVRSGMLSLAATLTSLYPVTTVLLARLVLRERIGWLQGVGLGCALAAVVLITAL